MNEEEIINRIKYRINEVKLNYAIDNLDLKAIQGLLDLYNQEKESHKLDNENYKILHDDVTALAKYMGLEENAIIDEMYETFDKEKEKNKKLEETINNLAKAVKFMGTNDELTANEIIKMFSPEEIKMNFDDFVKRWENEQHKKADLKDKVIDMMAEDIYYSPDDWLCKTMKIKEDCYADTIEDNSACKECIKQYYFKKARGEEDEKTK